MRYLQTIFYILWFTAAIYCADFPINIKVVDSAGLSLKDQLVIVQDLENAKERVRILRDNNGCIPPLELPSGLYRIIVTNPYGAYETVVTEYLVGRLSANIVVRVRATGIRNDSDVYPPVKTKIRVIGRSGNSGNGTGHVNITVVDKMEAVIGDTAALVIVQDLKHPEKEFLRILTQKNGCVPPLTLPFGTYRLS
jgi:hypothetical protein